VIFILLKAKFSCYSFGTPAPVRWMSTCFHDKSSHSIRLNFRFTEQNAKVWNNVGHSLESEGKFEEALHYFYRAVR